MQIQKLMNMTDQGELFPFFKEMEVSSIVSDSRRVQEGSLFVAVEGPHDNGLSFIQDAMKRGARGIVIPKGIFLEGLNRQKICVLEVNDPVAFLSQSLRVFHEDPQKGLKLVGITGTNGKTTITYLIESILRVAGMTCGVIGTVNHRLGEEIFPAKNTTPGLVDIYEYLHLMDQRKMPYGLMEVSSHALDQRRVEGLRFDIAIFTNLTGDHLDYHHTLDEYFAAKSKLFEALSPQAFALVNKDDPYGRDLVPLTRACVQSYGIETAADIMAQDIQLAISGTDFILVTPQGKIPVHSSLIGLHNVYNMLAAAGFGLAAGISLATIQEGFQSLPMVPGRLERISEGQNFSVFVDYAHTEDALKNVLQSLKKVCPSRIILVFGCGGDRDQDKRPKMGRVAADYADTIIVTNDNPRTEDPQHIIHQIREGLTEREHEVIVDREKAIRHALDQAHENDVVLVAGKGHEDYQILKDKTIPFLEREIIRAYLRKGKA